jgi:lipopolysaccharide/colanic/teichoic acid biosynthesis glycosyltransferase
VSKPFSYVILKRTADIVAAAVAILVLSPILIATAFILLATGEHKVIYRQRRVGKDYREFDILKFVTMRSDSEKFGTITAKNDPRVLPVGAVLRKTKINELPQLFNILFGTMSIVGPRPLVASEVEMYPDEYRGLVYENNQPGLTGIGSLFFRNEDELIDATGKPPIDAYREDIMPIKGALEGWYRERKGALIDISIVVLTAWAVVHSGSAPVVMFFRKRDRFPLDALAAYERLQNDVSSSR